MEITLDELLEWFKKIEVGSSGEEEQEQAPEEAITRGKMIDGKWTLMSSAKGKWKELNAASHMLGGLVLLDHDENR